MEASILKLIGLLATICLLVGCDNEHQACQSFVEKRYPKAEVDGIPGRDYSFLVRLEEGEVLYVETTYNARVGSAKIVFVYAPFQGKNWTYDYQVKEEAAAE